MIKLIKKALKKWLRKKAKASVSKLLQKYLNKLGDKKGWKEKPWKGNRQAKYAKSNIQSDKQRSEISIGNRVKGKSGWQPPETAKPYLASIRQAEQNHQMPENLLARLIYQESRYRKDIITGKTVSSAGAMGIAQIVPKWHPNVDPLNPEQSIHYAAKYLSQLQKQFGDWPTALAAYNWGPGNVSKAQKRHGRSWLDKAPRETQNYVSQIWDDVA